MLNQRKLDSTLKQVKDAHKRLKQLNDQLEQAHNRIDLLETIIATKNTTLIDLLELIERGDMDSIKSDVIEILMIGEEV